MQSHGMIYAVMMVTVCWAYIVLTPLDAADDAFLI